MKIDNIQSENKKLLTLGEAAKLTPSGHSTNSLWRWCRKGIKCQSGIRLRLNHIRIGGVIYTTAEDMSQFFSDVAKADLEHFDLPETRPVQNSSCRTSSKREKQIAAAQTRLQQAGIF